MIGRTETVKFNTNLCLTLSVLFVISPAIAYGLPKTITPFPGETRFNSSFGRPDGKSNYSINQTVRFKEDNLEYRFITGVVVVSNDKAERTYIPVRSGVTTNIEKSTTLTVLGGVDSVIGREALIAASVGLQSGVLPNLRLGIGMESQGVLEAPEAIDLGIRTVNITPSLDWRIDKETRLNANYKIGFYSDGNSTHSVNSRLERSLGNGLYSAANLFYYSVAEDLKHGYWSPNSYTLAGVEIGWKAPINKYLGVQVGIQPSYINNDGEQKFGVGGGLGMRWQPNKNSTLELWARGGYGINAGGNFVLRF